MWFVMPAGCGGITVERQEFSPEFEDEKGRRYFRAPDHFATRILALQGFASVGQPEGAPADLVKEDPVRDQAIVELTGVSAAQADEIRNLRSDLTAATATIAALKNENTDLKTAIERQGSRITELEEELEDRPAAEAKKKN